MRESTLLGEPETERAIAAFLDRAEAVIGAEVVPSAGAEPGLATSRWGIVGIHRRGDVLAERLRSRMVAKGADLPALGIIDITLYRDDFSPDRPQPTVRPSLIPFDLDGLNLLLVDDVFQSGRTIRAALTQLADFGRPRRVVLAVFIDRMQRELPIRPDVVGMEIERPVEQRVQLRLKEVDGCDQIAVVTRDRPELDDNPESEKS